MLLPYLYNFVYYLLLVRIAQTRLLLLNSVVKKSISTILNNDEECNNRSQIFWTDGHTIFCKKPEAWYFSTISGWRLTKLSSGTHAYNVLNLSNKACCSAKRERLETFRGIHPLQISWTLSTSTHSKEDYYIIWRLYHHSLNYTRLHTHKLIAYIFWQLSCYI